MPARSFAPAVTVAMYSVLGERAAVGVNVAVKSAALYATVPATAALVAATLSVKVVVLIVAGAIASLNVAVIAAPVATPVARLAGVVAITVGGASSSVVNIQTKFAASGTP